MATLLFVLFSYVCLATFGFYERHFADQAEPATDLAEEDEQMLEDQLARLARGAKVPQGSER